MGAVPVVAAFGGPGDVVKPDVGYAIPMVNEAEMVLNLQSVLKTLAENPAHLEAVRQRGMTYVMEVLTHDTRARTMTDITL